MVLAYMQSVCVLVAQLCPSVCDPMNYTAHQALLSMGFSRQGYWNGMHALLQRIFLIQGSIEPMSPVSLALAGRFFTTSATWEAH